MVTVINVGKDPIPPRTIQQCIRLAPYEAQAMADQPDDLPEKFIHQLALVGLKLMRLDGSDIAHH